MIQIPCYCPWDVPGVEALPGHHHYDRYVGEPGKGHLVPDIYIWVPWKDVARAIIAEQRTSAPASAFNDPVVKVHKKGSSKDCPACQENLSRKKGT